MADAKQQTKAKNGKPSDVNRQKQKNEASERNTPVPSAKPQRTPTGEVVPTPSRAPVREQSGGGMGDYLDMIMGAAFPGKTQRSFGDNAPSTMTPEDIAAMEAEEQENASADFAREQSLKEFTDPGTGLGGRNDGEGIDPAVAPQIEQLADDGYSIGQISAALGGAVGAAAIATYLATRKGKKSSPDMIDDVMAQTDTPAQRGPVSSDPASVVDGMAQNAVEGNYGKEQTEAMRSKQQRVVEPAASDLDMMVDESMQGQDNAAMKAIEGSDGQRTAPNRHSGNDANSALLDRAASMRATEAIPFLQQNGIDVTPDLIESLINRATGSAASRVLK